MEMTKLLGSWGLLYLFSYNYFLSNHSRMRLNVEDGLPVELAGCDEEQTPRPEQIHNLHDIRMHI